MTIRWADWEDWPELCKRDHHLPEQELRRAIRLRRVLVGVDNGALVGWLRYNLFWDNTPFLNLLYVKEEYRNLGWGRALHQHWEEAMKKEGFSVLLTSTQAEECSQHFYRRLGYRDIGGFLLPPEPYELMLAKKPA